MTCRYVCVFVLECACMSMCILCSGEVRPRFSSSTPVRQSPSGRDAVEMVWDDWLGNASGGEEPLRLLG